VIAAPQAVSALSDRIHEKTIVKISLFPHNNPGIPSITGRAVRTSSNFHGLGPAAGNQASPGCPAGKNFTVAGLAFVPAFPPDFTRLGVGFSGRGAGVLGARPPAPSREKTAKTSARKNWLHQNSQTRGGHFDPATHWISHLGCPQVRAIQTLVTKKKQGPGNFKRGIRS